jgi:hypothetical protein
MPDHGAEIRLALITALAALKAGKITPAEANKINDAARQALATR